MPDVGIDAGDAVITFLADDSAVEAAFTKLDRVPERLAPADAAVAHLGEELDGTAETAEYAGEEMMEMGEKGEVAGKMTARAMREAKGEIALLGEETGIKIPRHLRAFVAELPGVGEALNAAFSATAVFILVQILAEGTKKLTEWISTTFIFTKAMKESEDQVKAQNAVLLDYAAKIKVAEQALSEFGKSPLQKATESVTKLTKELADQAAQFAYNEQVQSAFRQQMDGVTEAQRKAAEDQNKILSKQKELQQELITQAQLNVATITINTTLATAREVVSIDQSMAQARLKIWQASNLMRVQFAKDAAVQTALIEKEAAAREFQIKMDGLKREREALVAAERNFRLSSNNEEADKMVVQIKKVNAKIEEETAAHYKIEVKKYMDFQQEFKNISDQIMSLPFRAMPSLGPVVQDMQVLEDAAKKLGVTLSGTLEEAFRDNEKALAVMSTAYHKGQISLKQYDQSMLTDIQSQIAWMKSVNLSTTTLEKQEKVLQDEINGVKKTNQTWDAFAAEFAKKSKSIGSEGQAMGKMLGSVAANMDEAFASAITGAMASGESIAKALEQATASVLLNLATQAGAHALYCIAMGTAELALGVTASSAAEWFTAAAEFGLVAGASGAAGIAMSGGRGGGGSGAPSSAAPMRSGGGMTMGAATTIHRMAAGSLVTGPTLAMIGEGVQGDYNRPQEVVLPLDDKRAMSKLRNNLGTNGAGGDTHVHFHKGAGLIAPETLKKTMKQMNGMVKKRTATLNSTNTYRVQKRST